MLKKICKGLVFLILQLVKYLPFQVTMKIRNYLYKYVLKSMGKNCNISDAVTIYNPQNVSIGNRVSINVGCYIGGEGEITIGNYVAIAHNCSIISETHNFSDTSIPIKKQGMTAQPISIGDNVWLGGKVSIMGNTIIGDGAIIGTNSVVTKDIPENAIAVGVPCKVIRFR